MNESISIQDWNYSVDARIIHLVGSVPFKSSEMPSTMPMLMEKFEGRLISWPDGEPFDDIVDRSHWVNSAVRFQNKFESSAFKDRLKSTGLDHQLYPSVSPEKFVDEIKGLGNEFMFNKSYPIFQKAVVQFKKEKRTTRGLAFQVGVPTSF